MRTYIGLSLRRERLLLVGLAACFILSLPFGALLMKLSHETALRGYHAALALWTLIGLPGIAVLFGASAGVRLRQEPDKGAEEAMPLSPRQRTAAACAAAGIQVLILSLCVMAVAWASSGSWREMFLTPELNFKWEGYPYIRFPIWLLAGGQAVLLLWSFLWAYLLGNGILGGMLGILWAALPFAAFACALALRQDFGALAAVWSLGIVSVAAAFAGPMLCLRELPPRVERLSFGGLRGALVFSFLALMGFFAAGAHLRSCWAGINRSFVNYHFGRLALNVLRWPGERPRNKEGLLLGSIRGDLVLHGPDGTKELLLRGEDFSLGALINQPWHGRINSAVWGDGGVLWVLNETDGGHAIWRREPRGRMTRHTWFLEGGLFDFVWRGKELGIRGKGPSYAPLPSAGGTPRWARFKDYESWHAFLNERPRLDPKDRRVLEMGRLRWRLPGEGWEASARESAAGIFISVALGKGRWSVVLCAPDGKVRPLWEKAHSRVEALPDGTLWAWRDKGRLFLLTPDGKMRESLAMDRTLAESSLARVEGPSLWFLQAAERNRLAKVDIKTGAIKAEWPLPDLDPHNYQFHRDGLFLDSGVKMWFVGWDGATRVLDTSPPLPGPS